MWAHSALRTLLIGSLVAVVNSVDLSACRSFTPSLPPLLGNPIQIYKATSKYVTSKDGSQIYTEAVGSRDRPCVIMATGLASTTLAFDRLFHNPILRASLCMVRYDPRGHGLTDKPTDPAAYNSSRYAEDVDAIVSTYGLIKPFFAGWSLGAAIAPDLAAYYSYPLPFSGLISFAGLPAIEDIPNSVFPAVIAGIPLLTQNENATLALEARKGAARNTILGDKLPAEDMYKFVGGAAYLLPTPAKLLLERTQNITRFLEEGRKGWPTRLFWGDSDKNVNLTAAQEYMKPFKNLKTYVFKNAAHNVMYDAADEVAEKMLKFVYEYYCKSY